MGHDLDATMIFLAPLQVEKRLSPHHSVKEKYKKHQTLRGKEAVPEFPTMLQGLSVLLAQ